jgi:hypothetical protein
MVAYNSGPMSMGQLIKQAHSLGKFADDAPLFLDFTGGYWCCGRVEFITDDAVLMHMLEDDDGKYTGENVTVVPLEGLELAWWNHAEKED